MTVLRKDHTRKHVCDILKGGKRAYRDRARRLRIALNR